MRQLRSSIQDAQNSTLKLAQDFQTQLERERKESQTGAAKLTQDFQTQLEAQRRQQIEESKRESQRLVQACTEACNRELKSRDEQLKRCRDETAQVYGALRQQRTELHDSAVARKSLHRDVTRLEAQTSRQIARIQELERENAEFQRLLERAQSQLEPGERAELLLALPRPSSRRSFV